MADIRSHYRAEFTRQTKSYARKLIGYAFSENRDLPESESKPFWPYLQNCPNRVAMLSVINDGIRRPEFAEEGHDASLKEVRGSLNYVGETMDPKSASSALFDDLLLEHADFLVMADVNMVALMSELAIELDGYVDQWGTERVEEIRNNIPHLVTQATNHAIGSRITLDLSEAARRAVSDLIEKDAEEQVVGHISAKKPSCGM